MPASVCVGVCVSACACVCVCVCVCVKANRLIAALKPDSSPMCSLLCKHI